VKFSEMYLLVDDRCGHWAAESSQEEHDNRGTYFV